MGISPGALGTHPFRGCGKGGTMIPGACNKSTKSTTCQGLSWCIPAVSDEARPSAKPYNLKIIKVVIIRSTIPRTRTTLNPKPKNEHRSHSKNKNVAHEQEHGFTLYCTS